MYVPLFRCKVYIVAWIIYLRQYVDTLYCSYTLKNTCAVTSIIQFCLLINIYTLEPFYSYLNLKRDNVYCPTNNASIYTNTFLSQEQSASLRMLLEKNNQEHNETSSHKSMLEKEVKKINTEKKQLANKLANIKLELGNVKVRNIVFAYII